MSTPSINHLSTAIVGYSVRTYEHQSDLVERSSIPAEFKGGRRRTQPYRRVKIMFGGFRLEPEVCGIYKDTIALNEISHSSHDLQSMARIHR